MDLELITNQVFNRLMEKVKQHQLEAEETTIKKLLQCDGDMLIISGYKTVFLSDTKDENEFLEYEFLVICKLTIDEMASAVNGAAINQKTKAIRQFLLTGKQVYVIEEGLEHRLYQAISNPVYYNIFRDQEKKLVQCGVRIMSTVALKNARTAKRKAVIPEIVKEEKIEEIKKVSVSARAQYSTVKKLITCELAKELVTESNIILRPGTLITPYAKDVFKEGNATITFI